MIWTRDSEDALSNARSDKKVTDTGNKAIPIRNVKKNNIHLSRNLT